MSTKYSVSWREWLMLLCCALKAANIASWSVIQSPGFAEVMVGSSVRVKCNFSAFTASNDIYKSIIWTKVDVRTGELNVVYPTTNENFKAAKATDSCYLTIVGQSQGYSGMYYCWLKNGFLRLSGNGSRVVFTENVTASVEVFSPSDSNSSRVSFICWAKGVVPSQVRIFWIVDGHEYSGLAESVWSNDSHLATEFTQSRIWSPDWSWEAGMQCTCIVELKGRNISKTTHLHPTTHPESNNYACSVLVYGISFTSIFIVAGWVVVALCQGRRSKKLNKTDHRRKFNKLVSNAAGTSLNEVQYSSVNNTHRPTNAGLQRDDVSENRVEMACDD